MKTRTLAMAAAVVVGLNFASVAVAQTKIFVINEERIRRESKVGKEMSGALTAGAQQGAEKLGLKTLQDQIKTESEALKPQTQSLTPEAINSNPALKAKVDALNKKTNEYLQKAGGLQQGIEQQSGTFNGAFMAALEPAVTHVAKQVNADVVLTYGSTWYVKDAIDITPQVIARLDATIPTMAALQAALQPPAAAGGAKPATPPAKPATPAKPN
jgi:Skp family chaperone for outer membrane proteins